MARGANFFSRGAAAGAATAAASASVATTVATAAATTTTTDIFDTYASHEIGRFIVVIILVIAREDVQWVAVVDTIIIAYFLEEVK